jgi:gamma-glutamyltranspeptidase / glutathione hydrolase
MMALSSRTTASRFATPFTLEKRSATGSQGMVVTNHPLASAAGSEMLLMGGNAIDAAVAALFALTVVEPMMVGVLGGGISHLRLSDGRHVIIDGLSTAPARASAAMYEPLADGLPGDRETRGRKNSLGAVAVAVPGALAAWCHALKLYGTFPLQRIIAPARRLAAQGFVVTPYLSDCIRDCARDLATDPGLAALFLRQGKAVQPGTRLVQRDYAKTLGLIARQGPESLYSGALADAVVRHIMSTGGLISHADLAQYRPLEREAVISDYRGHSIIGPPPPASSGVHIAQMLNLLETYDIRAMGFGSTDTTHLLAEVMKIAFVDRAVATADPAFVEVPVEKLISKAYAQERGKDLRLAQARNWKPEVGKANLFGGESADTTHVTTADSWGNVVSTTQTINGLFGACVQIAGTGMLANNYMLNFDPRPGRALSIAPGKRCFTSMAPMMILRNGKVQHALGLPGALRIFPSAMQAIVNLIDHQMTPQEAVEAPRIWCEGGAVELEPAFPAVLEAALVQRGHAVTRVNRVAGGMNAISFHDDGTLTGAACWRADGTPVGIAGGLARAGVRFSTN